MRAKSVWGALYFAILFVTAMIGVGALGVGAPTPASVQAVPKLLEEGGTDEALKARKNTWTVGVAGGLMSGTNMTFADEMAQILDDGDNLRVLPMVTYGAASNLDDLLYLRGVDVAITQSDVFEYFRTQRKINNLEGRVHYILRLPISEMHVLASTDIRSIEDLRGKKVNFGPSGSASSLTGSVVFQRYGVKVEPTLYDNAVALQKLKSGEIAATVLIAGKPTAAMAKLWASETPAWRSEVNTSPSGIVLNAQKRSRPSRAGTGHGVIIASKQALQGVGCRRDDPALACRLIDRSTTW